MIGRKILVTGAGGMLGSVLIKKLNCENIIGYGRNLDITKPINIKNVLDNEKPHIIIHTAAYTDVNGCELNSKKAYGVNAIGTRNLIRYCIENKTFFIYISSTGVYGSTKNEAYTEFDDTIPTTVHHQSKLLAEKYIEKYLDKYLILRSGWLYGGDNSHDKNFVFKIYLDSKEKDMIYADNTQIGNPTYINDLVKQIEVLLTNNQNGLFNCVNEALNISRFDYVRKIIDFLNINCKVKIAPLGVFNRIAPVSKNESAVNYKLKNNGLNCMYDWEKALWRYIKTNKFF